MANSEQPWRALQTSFHPSPVETSAPDMVCISDQSNRQQSLDLDKAPEQRTNQPKCDTLTWFRILSPQIPPYPYYFEA
jgi:hypothetical protein